MSLNITATGVEAIAHGIWRFRMPPHEVRLFGTSTNSHGQRSVILLDKCKFKEREQTLTFALEDAHAVNVGTASETVAILSETGHGLGTRPSLSESPFGPGDKEFLQLCQRSFTNQDMQLASRELLTEVRKRSAGDLKRGQARNFADTPDNFWYVIVQPRIQQLSITVRGTVEHFRPIAELPIKDDRGNTLFKITSTTDVPAALDLIFHARRKR